MEARQHQARRVVEYHQNHIADHLIRCERGGGNDRPFRHTLSTSVDPPRRRDKNQDFLVETHVPPRPGPLTVKPRMVKPLLRLRRPGGSSERSAIGPPATARKALVSPRLPPLVYEGIDRSLAGKRLPAAWFADPPSPKLLGLERSESIQEPSADEAYREEEEEPCASDQAPAEQTQKAKVSVDSVPDEKREEAFDPPLRAKGLYHFPDFRTEWRACEVLAYNPTDEQFLIQWLATGRQKRVTALQLRFHSETEADALRRQKDAELRRDTVEAMMLEEIVIEELSRWQLGSEASAAVNGGSGASVKRIMDLAQLKRYEASPQVVQNLIREAAEAYCRSQAKWLLLWRRPDLEEYLGVKPVPIREPRNDLESELDPALSLEDVPDEESEGSAGSWWEPPPKEPPEPVMPRPRQGLATKGPGGVRGNLLPNRKFRNLSSPTILQKSQELGQLSLLGEKEPQSRLLQVYNLVGSLYCEHVVPLYFPVRKREPYSLAAFARSLVDGFSRSSSFYRISWPESITLFFMTESGIIKDWNPRMSGLVARLMEAGLQHLCLKNLQRLLELFEFYAKLTADCREGRTQLTYMPPPVYLRMASMNYEQHPLFFIQVTVERHASGDKNPDAAGANGANSFIPSLELAIESAFASADTKSLDVILRRKKFNDVVTHMAQRWKLDTAKMDLLPDGAAHGGAPTANTVAALRNTAHMLSQLASGYSTSIPDEALSSDDERPSVDELLMAPPTRRQDIKVLFQDTAGQLEVKLTAHPTEFREVLGDHFRKVVELTEKYSTIDGSLQQDGEVKQQYLASLSSMQKVDQERYEEQITSCFFDPYEVVYEVHQYQALLQRFSHQEEQLKKMSNMRFDEVAGVAKPEGQGGQGSQGTEKENEKDEKDEDEVQSQSPHSSFSEERFATGITSSIEELREHLDRIDGWHKELNEAQDLPERHLGLFVVDVTPLRKALMAMCACCRLRLMGVVQRWLEDACAKLKLSLQAKSGEIIMSPKQPDELHSTILAVKSLDPFLVETAPVLASIRQMFEVLESRYHQVPRALVKRWYECIHAVPDLRDRAEKWQNIFRKDLRGKFNIRIAEKAKILSAQVQECRLVLEEYACKVSLTKAEFYYNKMHKLQERVAKLQEQVQKQHVHEEMMEMPLSEFPGLASTAEQIAPLLDLWFLAHDWNQWQDEILFGEFSKIDPNGVKQKLQSCTETMKRLEEVFATQPRPRQVLHSLSLELTELRVLLPVIVSLRNPGLRERHWTLIGEAIDQNIQANQMKEMNLSNMNERFPFVAHLAKIQAISETASKEMLIEEELRRMQENWAKLHFEFKPIGVFGEDEHRVEEESSSLVADLHHAEVWELITEQMAKVRTLGRRPNAAVHEKDLVAHDAKLKIIGELCDRLHEAQYGYVLAREHMLQEGLVKELMQRDTERNKEWKRFFEVEKQWQNIMMHLKSSNTWLQLLEVPKISFFCREAAATMEHIQRSIHDVLDIHRKQVPHLYRLSDAELMRVIRYGHNPAEPAIRSCLPGVFALDVGPSVMSEGHAIRGLVGDMGEYLSLPEELAVQEGMQIKDWLPKLISGMSHLLRWSMFGLMLSNFSASDPRVLDEKYPLQVRAAALDLAFTTEVEALLMEITSASLLQARRLSLCALIDQIQERRLQAADSEDRGVDFESFIAGSSSEEETETEEEETETEEEEDENEDEEEEEEEEEEEATSDESVESEESDEQPAGGRMAARKAVRLEPPPLAPGGPSSARSSRAEMGGRKKETGAHKLLPQHVQAQVPWQLFRISMASALQQLLRWREIIEQLELERPEGLQGKLALTSYRWLTTLRHYMRSKTATNGEEFQSYVDRGQYTLSMAGFDIGYAWQYLGNVGPAGRMYWDPQTEKGQLIMVHSFATARGVMSCGECRGEAPAYLARQLGIVQEKIFVNWRTSFLSVWRHLEGAMLAKMWLTISLEVSAHVQVLSVLAQELHSHLNACRINLSTEAPTSWVSLECSQAMLAPQKLPLLLLQAFRPQALATPSLDAICELWLLSSSMRPTTAKAVAPLAAFAWRFCEASQLLSWTSHQRVVHSGHAGRSSQADIGRTPRGSPGLWQLRLLCETTVKITVQVRRARRLAKGRASSDDNKIDNLRNLPEDGSELPSEPGTSSSFRRPSVVRDRRPSVARERRPSIAREELESERPRRPTVQGALLQDTLAPSWARACLYRAFELCFLDSGDSSDGASELMKLLNVSEDDLKVVNEQIDRVSFEADAKAVLEEMGLTARESQIQALRRMNSWVDQCHSETDYCIGMPPTRAVLVLGAVAVGKSSCIDALSRQAEPWELRRLNTTSLALDACDALQRPVAGSSRLLPPNSSMGILDTGTRLPGKTRKVLVHVDGELGPLQESFLASLNGMSEPCSAMRQGLQISKQSWLRLPGGVCGNRLAVAFEMGVDGCQSLGPDLVTRCGVVHLMEEDLSAELSSLIQSWCNQAEAHFENANISHTVQCLCKDVLVPLMLLVYGDQIKAGTSGLLAEAAQKLTELSSTATVSVSRKTIKKRPVTSKLSQQWALPSMPCRALFLRVQQAFQDIYGHFDKLDHEGRGDGDLEADDHNRRSRTETMESISQAARSPLSNRSPRATPKASPRGSPRGSPRTSRVAARRQDRLEESPEVPSEGLSKGRRKSSLQKQIAKKASTLLLLPEVDFLAKEDVVLFDSEATVAFVFATLSSFKALLHDSASGLLEEFALRLVDLIGPPAEHVRLPVEFSILDSVPDEHLKNFYHVDSILKEPDMADLDSYIFVPTQQSKRFLALNNVLQRSQSPLLLMGPCGSGKSLLLSQMIAQLPLRETPSTLPATYAAHCGKVVPTLGFGSRAELLYMGAAQWIQPGLWERSLQSLTRSSKTGLRPRLYSWCVFVIDDCHCANESLREAWRFNLERKLVHFPGSAGINQSIRKGFAGKRGPAERLEREATLPSLQHLEGVMMVMAARSLSDIASRHNFLRHTWMYNLEPLQESDILKIVGENMSHFIFVKDISPSVTSSKMLYVRFLHALQLKLQETHASTRLVTPHVLFRFFKSLLSQPTECLCDLKPMEFHKFFLHELLRETVDRLPMHRQQSAIADVAQLQQSIFGGLDRHGQLRAEGPSDNISEASGAVEQEQDQLTEISETLRALQYTSLEPVTDMSKPQRVQKNGYSEIEDPHQLCASVRLELQRGWERAKAITSEVSPMLWSLNAWGAPDREQSFQEMLKLRYESKGFERNCAGLEPRHLILSDEYIFHILRLGRLFELAAGASQNKVWGRQGGKVLVLAPSIPVAICVIRGAAHLHGLTFDTPVGRPASEGTDTGTTQGMPVLGLSHEGLIDAEHGGYATGLTGAAFRGWIKEKLLNAIQDLSLGMVLCIPPAILNHQDNLAVLHEAFAQEGPPPHWYSEREAKECEDAIAALPMEARLLAYLALEDEEGETPATLDVFWAEALGRVQFVLLLSNEIPEERISCGQCTVSTLDTSCPQFLQMAVLHMSPPSVDAYSAAAKVHLSSPILDPPETWQPASPFKADLEQATLAEATAELVRVAHFVAKEPPAGMAPRFLRSTQVPGLGVLDPTLAAAQSSAWNGEVVQSGLLPALGGLGDVGDILFLAQGLCRFKGQELARQYTRHKDAHNLLDDLQTSAASSNASKLQQQLAEITRRFNEAQEEYEEKKAEHAESQKEFTQLLDEVVNRCTQKANAVEAAEELVTKAKSEVESGRFQLLNFSKQDGVELRKAVHQHCTNDERTPTLALMELCCMLMKVSSTPTRDEVRTTLSEPNFATKMAATCAVDAENFSEAFVQPMKEAAAAADGTDTLDVKALSVLANVALPACQYTVTVLQLPKLRRELRDLEEQRELRRPELEDMETQTQLLFEDAELRKAKAEELEQEMQRVEVLSTSATSKRSRTSMMTSGLRQDRIRWGWKLQELQRRLQCLVGDALLSAAATELLGTYGPQHREELLEHWKEVLERLSIPHSKDFDLASYWIEPTARYRLHTELALPKDIHLEESLVFACLQTSKWPVFYDPDHLAAGFLQKFFPGAVRLTMGSTDFQKDLLSSLSSRAVISPSDVSEVLGQVVIIENAYLPAIRDTDILTELVARRQLVAAGLQTAGLVQLSAGVEDTVVHVDPHIVLIFITDMGEPWNHDAMSKNFLLIDFQLTREADGLSGPLMDLMTDTVCAKAMPSVQQELKQLQPEFSQLMAEWYRQDKELIQKLAFHHHDKSEVEFPTEEQLRETMNLKMNLDSVGRKLLKSRDSEVKLQQQLAAHDLLVSSLCAMAVAAEEIFNLCPASSIPLSGAWRLCEEFIPEPPPEDRKKSNRDSDYAGMARRAVLAGLWERISPGLPRLCALAAALRLTMASAMPQKPLQEILATLLLQCPAGDPRVFQHSLNGLLCSAMQAILRGRGLSDALQQYRQVEGAPQNPRASFRTLFEIKGGQQSSKKSSGTDSRTSSKTMASVNRSMMSLGNLAFSEMDEESEEEQQDATKRRSSTAETAAALRAAGEAQNTSAELMQILFVANKGHWSHCNSKQIFLARFAYFQETLRCQLEHCIRDEAPEAQSKESVSLPDLFRVNRMELFGIDDKHLEDLLAEAPHRDNKDFMARRSTRNLVTADEGGENVAEGGADTPQLFSLLLHFGASFGHGACGPWTLQLHVEPQARSLVDRLEDSVNNDPGAWARWAESIATQNYRKGMMGHNALSEHLPLLASLPHDLMSSLLPQGGPSSHVTLKTICGAGFLQTILFSVLASFSLSAVLHASELIVAGATGNATPLRRMSLPRLLEPEGTHRSALPVVCLCDSEASYVVENIHRIHQAKEEAGRKVIQLSLTDLVANSTTGKAGQSAGERPNCWSSISPAAECASTPSGVLELLEECKDLGYWLLLHLHTSSSRLPSIEHLGLETPHSSFQLLERIWFTCSTPSFQSTADEKFRLFVIIDCRCPVALPSWLFRCGRSDLCVVDSAGTPSLRSWLEEALDAMPRRAQSFLSSMVLPAAPSASSKVATGFKTLTDAANASQLAAEGKMGRVMMSPVLCSKLAQPNFPLKLQTSGQRLAMLVLAAACDGGLWPKCILKTRSIGGPRVAEVVEELNFDVTVRSVDMLEIFAPLALQQAHKCPVWPDSSSFPGPSISAILYNLLRQIRQVHLSRLQEILVAPAENQKSSNAEVSKRSSAARTSQLNVLASAPRKSRKNIDIQDLDELLWYHDEHFESKDSAWKVFATLVEAMERISNQGEHCGEAEEQQLQEALKMLPLLDPFSIRLAAPCDAIFTMALTFSTTRRGRLKLPELPDHLQEAVTPDAAEGQAEERKETDDLEVDEVQESPMSTKRKVSGVQTLQFKIPSIGHLPSDLGSSSEGDQEESPEVALGRRAVDAHSASRMALIELLKATQVCVEGSEAALPKSPPRGEKESPLQAEWRRQRSCIARWAWDIHAEALALIRGLEGECMSPKMSLKLRHLLHSADLWAARAEPEDTTNAPPVSMRLLPNCPIEVFHVAKSHAAATLPVPDGWQPPHFRDEANFGSWLTHLAMQLYQVYVSDSVPRNLHISDLAQLEPLLLSLRLCLAGQKNLQVEQTCLVFLPSAPGEDAPESPASTSSKSEYKAVSEDFSTWDELDTERPPAFKAACKLPQQLAAAMAPLFAEKVEAPRISLADGARSPGSPGSAGSPSAASAATASGATEATGTTGQAGQADGERKSMSATFTKSVRKVAMMASLSAKPGRRSTVRPGTKKLKEKDPTFVQKEISEEDLVLQGLLADGAVWSTQGLHIDSNVAGVTRLPPLRVVAATLKAAEYIYSQAFPQALGCMNLFVHRLFGSPWPLPTEGLLPRSSVEMFTVRLPFWSKPQNRWQPVMLLDGMGPSAAPGHLRQWEDDLRDSTIFPRSMEDHLEESLSVARPFGLLPTDSLLCAMAGPPMLSRRKAEKEKKKI